MIRAATVADCAALAALWNPIIRDTLVTFTTAQKSAEGLAATLAEKASAGFPFLVADRGGLLGFATYGAFRAGPGYARTVEHTIILAPEARGQGVGRALMAAIEGHARGAGIHSMIAGVSAANGAPLPPLPPMTGGKIVSGTLNGGGPDIQVTTMNGDITLRKLDVEK